MSRKSKSTKKHSNPSKPSNEAQRTDSVEPSAGRRVQFWGLLTFILALPALALFLLVQRQLDLGAWADERILRYAATQMSDEEKTELESKLAALVPGLWNAVPEPGVGYLLQKNIDKTSKRARIRSNNAGLRSARPYGPKPSNRFRILCVGDSLVMGTGGPEEDRWGDQLEGMLGELGVQVDGKSIEVYSLGLDGWTGLNEATYLSSRVSAYDPDLVLVMMFQNDITDSGGVLGGGLVSYGFSPEVRSRGSGVMVGAWPSLFGVPGQSLLSMGLGAESTSRWLRTFEAWRLVEERVARQGGKTLFSVLGRNKLFTALVGHYADRVGLESPWLQTHYFKKRLPHDPHPNRLGHRILATHYFHALVDLGWLPEPAGELPTLEPGLGLASAGPPDFSELAKFQRVTARQLPESIAFDRLNPKAVRALLGGIYPGSSSQRLTSLPFATPHSAFLLKTLTPTGDGSIELSVEVDVPARVELYPFELSMRINGRDAAQLVLDSEEQAGRHRLDATLTAEDLEQPGVEVVLTTGAYWTEIHDDVMRSFRLVEARQTLR